MSADMLDLIHDRLDRIEEIVRNWAQSETDRIDDLDALVQIADILDIEVLAGEEIK